ncbi:MAG: RNA polymerase sigma factor [Acidobacteria bacterium]|nr:RNA polymerase sigma factor [Acidobacteriota bacterium]MDW7983086.1 RNA polymerase sigma factor [Acidobacteriota bacterium]
MDRIDAWVAPSFVLPAVSTLDDEALMVRVRDLDDVEAFEELVRRYEARARRLFLAYFGSSEDVEDGVQLCLLRLFEARRHYRRQDHFPAWFYRLAMNVAHDQWRKRRRWYRLLTRFRDLTVGSPTDADPTTSVQEIEAHRQVLWRQIQTAVQRLPRRQRQVVILRYVEDMSLAEIAETLRMPLGSVKAHLHYALRKIQRWVKSR